MKPQRICCICLTSGTDYYRLEYGFKDSLQLICPQLVSEIPEQSYMCTMCLNNLVVLGRFKRLCLDHEEKIRKKVIELGGKINLSQLAFPVYFMNGIDIYICRLCSRSMSMVQYANFTNLHTPVDGMRVGEICAASLPEVVMDYTYCPVFCEYCTNLMRALYRFMMMCLKTKFRIVSYIELYQLDKENLDRNKLLFAVRDHLVETEGHTYSYVYACTICGFTVREDVDLWNHNVLIHQLNTYTLRKVAKVFFLCSLCKIFLTDTKIILVRHASQHGNQPKAAGAASNTVQKQAKNPNPCPYILVDFMGHIVQPSLVPFSSAGKSATSENVSNPTMNLRPSHTSNPTSRPNLSMPSAQSAGNSNSTITSASIGKPIRITSNITQQNHTSDPQITRSNNIPATPSSNSSNKTASNTNYAENRYILTGTHTSILKKIVLRSSPSTSKVTGNSGEQSNQGDQTAGSNQMSSGSKPTGAVKAKPRVIIKRLIYRGNPSKLCYSNPNFPNSTPVPIKQTKSTRPNILKKTKYLIPIKYKSSRVTTEFNSKPVTENAEGSQGNTSGNATSNTLPPQNPFIESDNADTESQNQKPVLDPEN